MKSWPQKENAIAILLLSESMHFHLVFNKQKKSSENDFFFAYGHNQHFEWMFIETFIITLKESYLRFSESCPRKTSFKLNNNNKKINYF